MKNYAVRLAGSPSSIAGRVEIFRVGQWGTICNDEWDLRDAAVVCRQLGYSGAVSPLSSSHFGQGKGQIWLDNLDCRGNETNLSECPHNGWAVHNCDHTKDANVQCSPGRCKDWEVWMFLYLYVPLFSSFCFIFRMFWANFVHNLDCTS